MGNERKPIRLQNLPRHKQKLDHTFTLQMIIVSRAIKVRWHGCNVVCTVLPIITLTHNDSCNLGQSVGIIGRLLCNNNRNKTHEKAIYQARNACNARARGCTPAFLKVNILPSWAAVQTSDRCMSCLKTVISSRHVGSWSLLHWFGSEDSPE